MKEISFYNVKGQPYAKIAASSYREHGVIKKKDDGVYLGRVIDRDNLVFFNKQHGIYKYDPDTGSILPAGEEYSSELRRDKRRRERIHLDFGDSYFLSEVIRKMKYDTVINSLPYRNKDTLNTMIQYYVLQDKANCHAQIWYDGSVVNQLYPKANITSQRIFDFLRSIGRMDNVQEFFRNHIAWIKENICDDPAILIDSTGLPNSIHFPLTAVSNHNGKISREVRMATMVQRDSGYPLMFRVVPGNVTDVSTITYSIQELFMHKIRTDFVLIDAGYFTAENIEQLYGAGIEYLTRLPARNRALCSEILEKCLPDLRKEKNLCKYQDRFVYISRTEVSVGLKGHNAYAYLGYDIDRASDESHKAIKNAAKGKISEHELQKRLEDAGLFIIISSLPFQKEEILPTYYVRQIIEQYFDIQKGSSKLTPLRIQDVDALMGHLVLSMIAATINIYIMNVVKKYSDNREAMFMTLRNQKCLVYKTQINASEAQAIGAEFYKKFDIRIPVYLERTGKGLKPRYDLPKADPGQA